MLPPPGPLPPKFVSDDVLPHHNVTPSGRNTRMGAAAFWERLKPAGGAEQKEQERQVGTWIVQLKKGLAAIAAAKSSQQFGREEETK